MGYLKWPTTSCLSVTTPTTPFWSTLGLQQVNQLKGASPILHSTECNYVCCMARIVCTHINSCSSCHYNIHYYMLLYVLALQKKTRHKPHNT